jgi:hypothetical protein
VWADRLTVSFCRDPIPGGKVQARWAGRTSPGSWVVAGTRNRKSLKMTGCCCTSYAPSYKGAYSLPVSCIIEQGREIFIPFMQLFEVSGDYMGDKWFSKYTPEIIGLVLDP